MASLAPSGQFTSSCQKSALRNRFLTDVGDRRRRLCNLLSIRKGPVAKFATGPFLYVEIAGEVGLAAVLDEPFDPAGDAALMHVPVELHQGLLRDGEGGLPAFAGGEEPLGEGPEGGPGGL